jgi:hypothetical protein
MRLPVSLALLPDIDPHRAETLVLADQDQMLLRRIINSPICCFSLRTFAEPGKVYHRKDPHRPPSVLPNSTTFTNSCHTNSMTSAVTRPPAISAIQYGAWNWRVGTDFAPPALLPRLAAPHQLLQPPAESITRQPPRTATELVRLSLPELPAQPLFIKHYKPGTFWNNCKDIFRRSRARRAFENALTLQTLGLRTASPLAIGENRRWLWLREAFLICAEVPQADTLLHFYQVCANPRQRLTALCSLARQIAALHNAGFSHADPHALNFLVSAGNCRDIVLIDLDALRRQRCFLFRAAVRDLRKMLQRSPLSARANLRFAAEYARARSPRVSARKIVQALGQ